MDTLKSFEAALEAARKLIVPGERRILGLTGQPGAGKSTLTKLLLEELGSAAAYLPLDGFHLDNVILHERGAFERRGAPDTFDADGYVHLLQRLRKPYEEPVYAPELDRVTDRAIAGLIQIPSTTPLVITEGNYLLVDDDRWRPVRSLLDESWYVDLDENVRIERLVRRHEQFGKSPDAAFAWSTGPDQTNAELIASTRLLADRLVVIP